VNLKSAPDEVACAECVQAKLPASSMIHSMVPEGTEIGVLVSSDICGEMQVLGYNQEKDFIAFTNAARKTLSVVVLKNKKAETVLAAFKKLHNMMKKVFSHSIKRLYTDNGSEYDNDQMLGYLEDEGIEHTTTAPYQPQDNGIAERVNRTCCKTGARQLKVPRDGPRRRSCPKSLRSREMATSLTVWRI
jgi:Integrase core domain